MITQWKTLVATVVFALAIGSVGCGGGGGGGGDFDGALPDVPTDPLAITSANALNVARSTLGVTGLLSSAASGAFFPVAAEAENDAALTELRVDLMQIFGMTLRSLPTLLPQAGSMATIAVVLGPVTDSCDIDGTVTLTIDVADPNILFQVGDTMTAVFDRCDDGLGFVVSGTQVMTFVAVSGDVFTGIYDITAQITMSDLSVTESGETVILDGAITLREWSVDNIVINSTLSSEAPMSMVQPGIDAATLSNFVHDETGNMATMAYTIDSDGTLAQVSLGGSVQYQTTVAFEGNAGSFPYTGEMLVVGAAGSNETIIVLDSVNLRIEVDENGDGAVDRIIDTTWEAM